MKKKLEMIKEWIVIGLIYIYFLFYFLFCIFAYI